jgi:dTDP-4-amino-4,6-dideoxygalactose transaminase
VEDNAHGLFGRYRERALVTFGCMSAVSFHETKNFTCGEGGALLINDSSLIERAEIVREKGTDRSKFFRKQVDKYTWVDIGSSYVPSDLLAAVLLAQLEKREQIQSKRRDIWRRYNSGLASWALRNGVALPAIPEHCDQSYHMFYMLLPTEIAQRAFLEHMKGEGILAIFHYQPLHLSPMGLTFGGRRGDCPVAEDVSQRIVRLPFFFDLCTKDQDMIIECACKFAC